MVGRSLDGPWSDVQRLSPGPSRRQSVSVEGADALPRRTSARWSKLRTYVKTTAAFEAGPKKKLWPTVLGDPTFRPPPSPSPSRPSGSAATSRRPSVSFEGVSEPIQEDGPSARSPNPYSFEQLFDDDTATPERGPNRTPPRTPEPVLEVGATSDDVTEATNRRDRRRSLVHAMEQPSELPTLVGATGQLVAAPAAAEAADAWGLEGETDEELTGWRARVKGALSCCFGGHDDREDHCGADAAAEGQAANGSKHRIAMRLRHLSDAAGVPMPAVIEEWADEEIAAPAKLSGPAVSLAKRLKAFRADEARRTKLEAFEAGEAWCSPTTAEEVSRIVHGRRVPVIVPYLWIADPDGGFRRTCNWAVVLVLVYSFVTIPFRLGFGVSDAEFIIQDGSKVHHDL